MVILGMGVYGCQSLAPFIQIYTDINPGCHSGHESKNFFRAPKTELQTGRNSNLYELYGAYVGNPLSRAFSTRNNIFEGVGAIEEENVDIRRFIGVLLNRWWLILLLPLIAGLIGFFYTNRQEVFYQARATLLVQQSRGGAFPGVSDFALSQQLASTYTRLVKTTPFLQKVIIETDLPYSVTGLRSKISASTSTNPPVVEIVVSDRNSGAAATTANVVAQEFIDYIVEQRLAEIARLQSQAAAQGIVNVQDLVSAQLAAVNSLSLLEPVISASPVLPRIRQNVIISVIAGLILAIIIAFVLENLGDRVRSPEEISRRFGVTALGTIFQWTQQDAGTDELVLWKAPSSTYAESFRQVRANVQFATANQTGNIFLFCSPGPGEGKSTMTCNLAIALAQMGKKVIVIDGDLRRASVHKRFTTVLKEPGLSNYLADFTRDTATITHQSEVEGVSVIPAGPTPPNPSELLGSPKMSLLLGELKEQYDFILIDSPPILLVADGSILASQVNGVVVVVDGATTRSSSLQAALDMLRTTQVNIVGVVINKLKRARFGYGYGYPYYYYSYNGYYGTPESENGSLNGHRRFYHRPVDWVRSVFHHSDNIGS